MDLGNEVTTILAQCGHVPGARARARQTLGCPSPLSCSSRKSLTLAPLSAGAPIRPFAHVGTSCSIEILGIATSSAFSLVPIDASASLTACPGCACDLACPTARTKIVFDRFHIMRDMRKAVDTVRKQEHRAFLRDGDDSPLTGTKYPWLHVAGSRTGGLSR
jgi:transposase